MTYLTLNNFRKIQKNAKHQAALNWQQNIDVDKRIYEKLSNSRYDNLYEMNGEFLLVLKSGTEHWLKNKYAVDTEMQ